MTVLAFSETVASFYEQLMVPMIFEPYAEVLVRRASSRPHGRVLETAAGTGVVTRRLAAHASAPDAIVATDLSQAMLDVGKRICPAAVVAWHQADATSLPFPDASFDLVVCQFGAMFFRDRPRAYSEARRVLRPGGAFLFSVWDRIEKNELAHTIDMAVAGLFPTNPPTFLTRIPYGYFAVDTIVGDLTEAGFQRPPSVDPVVATSRAPSARIVASAYVEGSLLRDEIEARDPAMLAPAVAAAERALASRFGAGPIAARMQAFVVSVTR